ncbi:type II secretion system protein GspM [Marinobacter sp. CHS3-4]|uniref:type II secretion system protein GspM n=1 Tax=Marinobacter sp. CHS3-4 TaxID=3045174 RepID=UPI0024B5ABF5|nr:type II secretion system protein GspM [Marinobacter sp. CHS3-4]MDI9246667.1 type II secretion system protein GspM [Marinobacter sp. CHS3-4]
MSALKQYWEQGANWFNERPIRERALITITVLVLFLVVIWELAVTPVVSRNESLNAQIASLAQQEQALLEQQRSLTQRLASDPSQELKERLASRQARLDRLDAQLAETTGKLIAPRAMVKLLQDILAAQEKLELVRVELLAPTPIFDQRGQSSAGDGEPESDNRSGPLLYAHDVELVIRGGYLNVLEYVQTLEAMDSRLGWVSLDYEMQEYPDNEVRLRVRTLSLDRAWLGV